MKQYYFISIVLIFESLLINPVQAQEQLSEADYAKAVSFLWQNVNNKKAFNLNVSPNWFPDSTGFWYILQDGLAG